MGLNHRPAVYETAALPLSYAGSLGFFKNGGVSVGSAVSGEGEPRTPFASILRETGISEFYRTG